MMIYCRINKLRQFINSTIFERIYDSRTISAIVNILFKNNSITNQNRSHTSKSNNSWNVQRFACYAFHVNNKCRFNTVFHNIRKHIVHVVPYQYPAIQKKKTKCKKEVENKIAGRIPCVAFVCVFACTRKNCDAAGSLKVHQQNTFSQFQRERESVLVSRARVCVYVI